MQELRSFFEVLDGAVKVFCSDCGAQQLPDGFDRPQPLPYQDPQNIERFNDTRYNFDPQPYPEGDASENSLSGVSFDHDNNNSSSAMSNAPSLVEKNGKKGLVYGLAGGAMLLVLIATLVVILVVGSSSPAKHTIAGGNAHTVVINKDGTCDVVGSKVDGQCDVQGWTDIISVSAGNAYTLGLSKNGTVTAVGFNHYQQSDVDGWTDITDISDGFQQSLGLKKDGTLVAVGEDEGGQCEVGSLNINNGRS